MTATNSLPNGPTLPVFIRLFKFVTQPVSYLEDLTQTYGDTFTVWGRRNTPIVYFSQPQALQQIFNADASKLEAGRGNRGLK
ncbi:MAG TPA: cytochrome P450, partial [Cyanobacteria bacterium UBA11369]|nr:cytochrome P450 [Cyanobacteria bacterium UBA11369]